MGTNTNNDTNNDTDNNSNKTQRPPPLLWRVQFPPDPTVAMEALTVFRGRLLIVSSDDDDDDDLVINNYNSYKSDDARDVHDDDEHDDNNDDEDDLPLSISTSLMKVSQSQTSPLQQQQ